MGGKAGVCLRDEEVEDLQFRGPVTKKNCSDGASRLMAWGSAEMQGWRESMEDAHLVLPSLREAVLSENCKLEVDAGWENIGLFGVMDGHGGFQVAKFCERHLPEAIAARSSTDPAVAMAKSFVEMDELLQEPEGLKELRRLSALAKSARARRQTAEGMGCTVVLSCITPNALIVANAGDSRAVLCRNGQAVDLSKDHKPELPCERSRIESAGGWVEGGSVLRVNGDLSLSRAVGDLEYKLNPQLPPERQIVTSSPDVRVVPRQPQDEFLMLACDGVWDVLSSQAAVDFLRKELGDRSSWAPRLASGQLRLSELLSRLLDRCLSSDLRLTDGLGGDNMTAVLVLFLPMMVTAQSALAGCTRAVRAVGPPRLMPAKLAQIAA
ncbi:unnamed protein product [Symbiodinium necroappetens]|uniref:PPM-type phosphatase domain-containing protein n=1 Tax=Symbiodinium necroappetens TaxID=1628268 RepID=A0A812T2K1_9DINO|nr:unnamed protein product [Symbiodinium necroappetens]